MSLVASFPRHCAGYDDFDPSLRASSSFFTSLNAVFVRVASVHGLLRAGVRDVVIVAAISSKRPSARETGPRPFHHHLPAVGLRSSASSRSQRLSCPHADETWMTTVRLLTEHGVTKAASRWSLRPFLSVSRIGSHTRRRACSFAWIGAKVPRSPTSDVVRNPPFFKPSSRARRARCPQSAPTRRSCPYTRTAPNGRPGFAPNRGFFDTADWVGLIWADPGGGDGVILGSPSDWSSSEGSYLGRRGSSEDKRRVRRSA